MHMLCRNAETVAENIAMGIVTRRLGRDSAPELLTSLFILAPAGALF